MTRRVVLLSMFVLVPSLGISQGSASPIDGVWKIAELVVTGANPSTNSSPQPGQVIFTRGHYSWISVGGRAPRKAAMPVDPARLTDAEKVARFDEWNLFTANTGTFSVKGSTLTRRPHIAKNVDVMAATADPFIEEFKLEGDTLLLVRRSAAGQPSTETRFRLTRLR